MYVINHPRGKLFDFYQLTPCRILFAIKYLLLGWQVQDENGKSGASSFPSVIFLYRISLELIKLSIITSKEAMYCGCTQAKKAEVPSHQEHSDSPLQIKLVKMLGLKKYMLDKFVFRRKEPCTFCCIQPISSETAREGIFSTSTRKGTSPRPITTSR